MIETEFVWQTTGIDCSGQAERKNRVGVGCGQAGAGSSLLVLHRKCVPQVLAQQMHFQIAASVILLESSMPVIRFEADPGPFDHFGASGTGHEDARIGRATEWPFVLQFRANRSLHLVSAQREVRCNLGIFFRRRFEDIERSGTDEPGEHVDDFLLPLVWHRWLTWRFRVRRCDGRGCRCQAQFSCGRHRCWGRWCRHRPRLAPGALAQPGEQAESAFGSTSGFLEFNHGRRRNRCVTVHVPKMTFKQDVGAHLGFRPHQAHCR